MKSLLFLGLVALAWASSIKTPFHKTPETRYLNENVEYKQKTILQLFQYVYQPNYFPEYEQIGMSYNFRDNISGYRDPKFVLEFLKYYPEGSLPKGQVFSIFYDRHQNEAIAFFRLLYNAVDFDTFYRTACWGRMYLNEGLYIYALSVALVHRPDTWFIQLPPIYEIYPYYFYDFSVFKTAFEKTGFYFGNYQYMKQFRDSEFGQKSYRYPYYFGKYMQGQQQQFPYKYNQNFYDQEMPFNSQSMNEKSYMPYIQQYYQKYGQYPWFFKYEKSFYPQGPQTEEQYGPYTGQYYEKFSKFPWFSMMKFEKPYIQQYYQKYGQYPWFMQFEKSSPIQYERSYYPYVQRTEGNYVPYSGQYYEQFNKYPWFSMTKYGKQYPEYMQQYYEKYGQYPWLSKYERSYPSQYENSMDSERYPYGKQTEEMPIPLQYEQSEKYQKYPQYMTQNVPVNEYKPYMPYSPEYYGKFEKLPYFSMSKQLNNFQKSMQTPYSEKFIKKIPPIFYEKFKKAFLTPQFETQQKPWYLQRTEVPELYQQEREKMPLNYFLQGITIDVNNTIPFMQNNPERRMSYYTEDVGLNAAYYYYHIYFPFWMKNEEIYFDTQRRGELFYFATQQLLARYNLERISNGLGEIPLIEYDMPVGFQTNLMYPNGMLFPERPDHAPIENRWYESPAIYDNDTMGLLNARLYERRLLDAIDSGLVLDRQGKFYSIFEPQGFEILGNMIECNPESPNVRYYGPIMVFARYLLGYSNYPLDQYNIAPSVMEQYETSLRDPASYQLFKRMIYYFQRYKQYIPRYTEEELFWNGVKIQDVSVDKLVTYFDYFYSDISNVMYGKGKLPEVPIYVRQFRLNHQPFNYNLNVMSDKPYKAVVRAFLGPKYDVNGEPIDINRNRLNFVELDTFLYSLVPGLNTIQRNSREFDSYTSDRLSYKDLFLQLVNVKPIEITPRIEWGFPQRLLLPKGTKEGQEYQMYFIITPYKPVEKMMYKMYQETKPQVYRTVDELPFGYPFDRPIDESIFYVPNSYFKDVVIYNELSPEFVEEQSFWPYRQQ